MSWTCKLIDIVGTVHRVLDPLTNGGICGRTYLLDSKGAELGFDALPIGAMFYIPTEADPSGWPWHLGLRYLSEAYYRDNERFRRPLLVLLPSRTLFCVDSQCWSSGHHYGGWTVTGQAPDITVSPSINIQGFYHGFLQNGVLTPDCEGRQYDEQGNLKH